MYYVYRARTLTSGGWVKSYSATNREDADKRCAELNAKYPTWTYFVKEAE